MKRVLVAIIGCIALTACRETSKSDPDPTEPVEIVRICKSGSTIWRHRDGKLTLLRNGWPLADMNPKDLCE